MLSGGILLTFDDFLPKVYIILINLIKKKQSPREKKKKIKQEDIKHFFFIWKMESPKNYNLMQSRYEHEEFFCMIFKLWNTIIKNYNKTINPYHKSRNQMLSNKWIFFSNCACSISLSFFFFLLQNGIQNKMQMLVNIFF